MQLHKKFPHSLKTIQKEMFVRAKQKQQSLWHKAAKLSEFGPILEAKNGIYQTGWCQQAPMRRCIA